MITRIQLKTEIGRQIYLAGDPHMAYLLQAAEKWGPDEIEFDASELPEDQVREISGYTKKRIMTDPDDQFRGKVIQVSDRNPLLMQQEWNWLFNCKSDAELTDEGRVVARVLFPADEGRTTRRLEEKITRLDLKHKEDRVMADAVIKAGLYPVRPVRYMPDYRVHNAFDEKRPDKPGLLFSAPWSFLPEEVRGEFEKRFNVTYAYQAPEEVTRKLLSGKSIWVTGTCPPYKIGRDLIASGDRLELIATPSTGTNHINVKSAEELGVRVCSIKTAKFLDTIHASSEHTFGLLLAMIKQIPFVSGEARWGHWREREKEFRTIELLGRTIGLIGYGRIGSNMARYCNQFGMKILAFDPFKRIDEPFVEQVESREELLERSDIVSLHYHLDEKTKNSFGRKDFEQMKKGSYFLNTARGELVDEAAMLEFLETGHLKAAAVDVISGEDEPGKWGHPVIRYAREHHNLIVTPHTAGLTVDSESKAAVEILREIDQALAERELQNKTKNSGSIGNAASDKR